MHDPHAIYLTANQRALPGSRALAKQQGRTCLSTPQSWRRRARHLAVPHAAEHKGLAEYLPACFAAGLAAAILLVDPGVSLAAEARHPPLCTLTLGTEHGIQLLWTSHIMPIIWSQMDVIACQESTMPHGSRDSLATVHLQITRLCMDRVRGMVMCPCPMTPLPPGCTGRAAPATCHPPGRRRRCCPWRSATCSPTMPGRACSSAPTILTGLRITCSCMPHFCCSLCTYLGCLLPHQYGPCST